MKSKNTVLFLITAFTLATISTLIGCEKQLLIMKMDDTKAPEKESTQIYGVGELRPGHLYTFGTIIIGYDAETWEQAHKKYTPITTVNDFLVSQGYTPTVRSVLPGRRIEVIDIAEYGGSIWSSRAWLLLEELQTVSGVVAAERSVVEVHNRFSNVLDGLYHAPETIMIQYDEETWEQPDKKHTPITTVNDFLVSQGYTPKVRGILHRIEVIDIGKNIDPLPLLEELRTVLGVVTAEPNFLHQYVDWLTGMSGVVEELEITANKVGKMVNGQLFELGLLLLTFEEKHLEMQTAPALAALQFLSDKGYKPIVRETCLHTCQL